MKYNGDYQEDILGPETKRKKKLPSYHPSFTLRTHELLHQLFTPSGFVIIEVFIPKFKGSSCYAPVKIQSATLATFDVITYLRT